MPTYEYVCGGCEHAFELFQQMSDPVKRKCPECGRQTLRRLIGSGSGVIFKGSGFYTTDYRSASYKKDAKAETAGGKDKAKDTAKDATKGGSEGKTAATPAPAPSKDEPSSKKT